MKVLIIEAQIKQYRFPFYQRLFEVLRRANIDLRVGYSDPPPAEATKRDACDLPVEYGIKVKAHWFLGERLLFQPLFRQAIEADLVIIDEGNRYFLNHIFLLLSLVGLRRIAFWGHAENRQDRQMRVSEWYRRRTLNWVSWWFAYTELTARYLVSRGVPRTKITAVDNTIDTTSIRRHITGIDAAARAALRHNLGIPASAPVGIYCGGLYANKRIPFLIESAKMVVARMPAFHLVVVGGGPDFSAMQHFAREHSWIHFVGPTFGQAQAELLAISDVFLMPAAVGLSILDAFAAGLPLLTTCLPSHGPEIEYLDDGVNGLMSEPTISAFADAVVSLFSHPGRLAQLQAGAGQSGTRYTIENMAANFQAGIQSCLGLPTLQGNVIQTHVQP